MEKAASRAPSRMLVSIEAVGTATAFLATNFARLMTGDTVYIDKGYHVVSSRQWFGLPYRAA
jgi:enoyl-[acyl-carrier protein] reductase I